MTQNTITKPNYEKTFLKILIAEVNWLLVYWNVSKRYNNKFIKLYGEDFFSKTKEILIVKNLNNNTEEIIEIKEPTNNYYIKFNYSDSIYQVKLKRIGKEDNKDYGYELKSNKIHSPNVKIRIKEYAPEKIKFKNIKTGEETSETQYYNSKVFSKEDIEKLYDNTMRPSWDAYKRENGYKEK